jgi:long-chain acyl-CoA synthetase
MAMILWVQASLSQDCKERLAAYKYPREIRIVQEFPLGPTGKILKTELRALVR